MSSFLLKIIAIIAMTCDHIGASIVGHFSYLICIGRIAFPIFAFQVTQGYIHTKDIKKYMIRLFVFALISQIPFMLFESTYILDNTYNLNVMFTMLLGVFSLYIYDKLGNKYLAFILITLITFIAQIIHVDYGAYGIAIIVIFYLFSRLESHEKIKNNKAYKIYVKMLMCISIIFATILKYLEYFIKYPHLFTRYVILCSCTCLPLIFICMYNGKKGPKVKYLFYVFYPLHLLIIYLIRIYMF